MRKQQGFTLIEIAIVLVIIGLLLGGVLKGQELITSARVRNLISQQDGVKVAYFGFLDRYRALPGDYTASDGQHREHFQLPAARETGMATAASAALRPAGERDEDIAGVGTPVQSRIHQRLVYRRRDRIGCRPRPTHPFAVRPPAHL